MWRSDTAGTPGLGGRRQAGGGGAVPFGTPAGSGREGLSRDYAPVRDTWRGRRGGAEGNRWQTEASAFHRRPPPGETRMEPRFLLMSDVAEQLNVSASQVYHM